MKSLAQTSTPVRNRYVLGFNEPDNPGQSKLSVASAISLWPSFNKAELSLALLY